MQFIEFLLSKKSTKQDNEALTVIKLGQCFGGPLLVHSTSTYLRQAKHILELTDVFQFFTLFPANFNLRQLPKLGVFPQRCRNTN